jgi:ATP-dependent DNA ligase
MMARRDPTGVRLLTRNGHDWAPRYPLIIEAVAALRVRSCLIDHIAEPGDVVFRHACQLGFEGIVSKRLCAG